MYMGIYSLARDSQVSSWHSRFAFCRQTVQFYDRRFFACLIHTVESFPLFNVEVRILRTLIKTLIVTRLRLDLSAHEGCKLEILQRWHSICSDLVPLDNVASVLCVSTHGTRAVTLVETFSNILGCESEVAVSADRQGLRRSHG